MRLAAPALLGLCGLLCVPQPIAAQTVEQFYKGLTFAILARDVLGLHVDVVRGYPGAPNLFLAMQSGEVDGQVVALSSLKANVELSPIDGAAIARLVAKSAATPRDVIRRYNSLIAAPR